VHIDGTIGGREGIQVLKRAFDMVSAGLALLVLSPILMAIALTVRTMLGPPILFTQMRPGLHGRPFNLYKFRTMALTTDDQGRLLPDAQRLTRFGQFLRSTSLDELPELWNVLKGEMSLVGPRPLLMQYLDLYDEFQARRHEVRPGMTGWAQVHGRNAAPWPARFAMDVWYVENQSLWLDLKILFVTLAKVWRREGVSQDGQATVEYFEGNE
jgi:sugar transferase EpsL